MRCFIFVFSLALCACPARDPQSGPPKSRSGSASGGTSGSSSGSGGATAAKATHVKLTLLSINDFHGQLDPLRKPTYESPSRRFRFGGAEALAVTVAELRSRDPDGTLLLDAGDFMQGSMLSNNFEGAPVRELFKLIGVDVSCIGNHEFDFGPRGPAVTIGGALKAGVKKPDLRGALKAFAAAAAHPLLSANIKAPDWPWSTIRKTTILTRRGVRIGVVGLTTTDTPTTTLVANVRDLEFNKMAPVLAQHAKKLRAAGADVIVALAHVGGSCKHGGSEPTKGKADHQDPGCHGEMFEMLDQLPPGTADVIIAGHAHRCIWRRYRGTFITEACSRGVAVGRIELALSRAAGASRFRVDHHKSRVLPPQPVCHDVFSDTGDCEGRMRRGPQRGKLVDNPLLTKHKQARDKAREIVARYRKKIAVVERELLTKLVAPLDHNYGGYSPLGYLFARTLRRSVKGADIGLMNGGGVRGSLHASELRYIDLYRIFPFDNQVASARLSGAEIQQLLEDSAARTHGGVIQVDGLRIELDCGPPRRLVRVTDARGRKLSPKRMYTVVMSDFMLKGGDGLGRVLGKVEASRKRIYNKKVRDVIADFLRKRGARFRPAKARKPTVTMAGGRTCSSRRPTRARHICR
ncbi:MAG: 5'-nucleotidase C-terminal domain-containing protein [Myxococcales bacterium]|nr:5'-nucleotidase C-terminal domain-containing protein [Myxococcales bacterium]